MIRVPVPLGARSYDVLVGAGALLAVADLVPGDARTAAVVTQRGIDVVPELGIEATTLYVPDGEAAKSLGCVEELCRGFSRAGMSRADVVVAVGGGV
ncbi:MAG TPA: 3-dehydroquinate synthase, partial [Acidimicrobiales bacterium]|nr:3-dehydroquinate synthase [Acidimicrobiales bacterium]